ncbi:Ark- serine/threonine protein kinase [Elasticomyces elasticus]|nr:Ark- serine/threonine protein kinase [Elasticomyces elasticus]
MATAAAIPHRSAARPAATSSQPAGTFLPGTKVQVGSQRVVIEKYLSEGGFAHVYVVRVPRENHKYELAVLKRVAVPDKDNLASMRTEVETMKKLKGHKKIVLYMDSHASQLHGGGYEVFLLMEYCTSGGLIDFMNTRLQHRLTEPEILKIFGDVAEGVACMHYLKPPLLHRDLKVENVLITKDAKTGTPIYKLCDFGSAANPRPAAKTTEEGRLIEEDVQKHTTMQYRSPEMIDVWRKQPIDEKADIWALGVLLYKLCYYTTPFEAVGQMAILNASFKYPAYPTFSERLKKFIGWMLKEDPRQRPNIYQVIKESCSMRGEPSPIKDIYAERTQSEARRNESLPSPAASMSSPPVGLQKVVPRVEVESLPDIAPMRRGRPTTASSQAPISAKPTRGDPFAALDSKSFDVRAGAVDELSKRFPSLDEFSIVHEKSGSFPFTTSVPKVAPDAAPAKLNDRVANALADEVFGQLQPKEDAPKPRSSVQPGISPTKSKPSARVREVSQQSPLMHQPTPVRPGVPYKSTGVGSSPPPLQSSRPSEMSKKPIWRVPTDHHRAASQSRALETSSSSLKPLAGQRPAMLDIHRSKSQTTTLAAAMSPTSSRPSLESRRPSQFDLDDNLLSRAKSAQARPRPASVYVNSNLDFLRDQEAAASRSKRPSMEARRHSRKTSQHGAQTPVEEPQQPIEDDMDFLRKEEGETSHHKFHRKSSGHHKKRSSLPSISAGAKNIFAGRFGDAFKRFEHSPTRGDKDAGDHADEPTTPVGREEEVAVLSPIQGSDATPSKHSNSDMESAIDETEDLPPDMRRELERRRLSQEERRVAAAAAEYRARVAVQGTGSAPASRASTIQKRVQSLLDEGRQSPVQKKTAEGYGKYANASPTEAPPVYPPPSKATMPIARNIAAPGATEPSRNPYPKTRQPQQSAAVPVPLANVPQPPASAPPTQHPAQQQPPNLQRIVSRPSVPPKSQALRTGSRTPQWPPTQQQQQPATSTEVQQRSLQPVKTTGTGLAALLAKDLQGVPEYPPPDHPLPGRGLAHAATAPSADNGGAEDLDLEEDFSKRYPSLPTDVVETEFVAGRTMQRVREVLSHAFHARPGGYCAREDRTGRCRSEISCTMQCNDGFNVPRARCNTTNMILRLCRPLVRSQSRILAPSACRSYAIQAGGHPIAEVFDARTKYVHKERAAVNVTQSRQVDYLRDEVASRLCDRLLDINRHFPRVLDFGANACNVAKILSQPTPDLDDETKMTEPIGKRIGEIVCTDTSPSMLYRDENKAFNSDIKVTREVLQNAEYVPYEPNSFDLVLSSQSLHWINDLPSVLTQFNHILKPDAPFLAAMSGGDTLYELRGSLQLAEQDRLGGLGTHISPLADVRDVGNLLSRAGFKLLTVDVDDIIISYPDIFALMSDLQAMGESNAALRRETGGISRDVLLAAEAIYKEMYGETQEDGSVTIPATFRTIYMIGWKESENTPKPLERGTGDASLVDILGGGGRIG